MKIPNFSRNHSKEGFLRCQNLGTIHNSKTTILNSDMYVNLFFGVGQLEMKFLYNALLNQPEAEKCIGFEKANLGSRFSSREASTELWQSFELLAHKWLLFSHPTVLKEKILVEK